MNTNVTDVFRKLGAPLNNMRWSWGAVRPVDGNVFLRIWADQMGYIENKIPAHTAYDPKTMVCYIGCHDRDNGESRPGWTERQEHIALIKAGKQAWGIQCKAREINGQVQDIPHERRVIESVDGKQVWELGEVFRAEDPLGGGEDYWVTMPRRPSLRSVIVR